MLTLEEKAIRKIKEIIEYGNENKCEIEIYNDFLSGSNESLIRLKKWYVSNYRQSLYEKRRDNMPDINPIKF